MPKFENFESRQTRGSLENGSRFSRAIRATAIGLSGAVLAACGLESDWPERQNALTSVESLHENGACADELTAISEYNNYIAEVEKNRARRDSAAYRSDVYAAAAELAETHDVDCMPEDGTVDIQLTPDFDVAELETCGDEYRAMIRVNDPDNARNDRHARSINIENVGNQLRAQLADEHEIIC